MATLRDYIANDRKVLLEKYKQQQLAIYNTNIAAVNNGGQLCTWTVPFETTWATFELWGAGGDGGGACCCAGNYMGGGSGNYAKKTITVVPGCTFNICAAASGCCSQPLAGTCGRPSYVTCTVGGAVVTCASGGSAGTAQCGHMGGMSCMGVCIPSCVFGCNSSPYDLALPSVSGADRQSNYCVNMSIAWALGGSKHQNNSRMSSDFCVIGMASMGCSRYAGGQASLWPSGGGVGGAACAGGCCWASWGAGGLVLVTYG